MFQSYTIRDVSVHNKSISNLKWSADGLLLSCVHSDKSLRLYSASFSSGTVACTLMQTINCSHLPSGVAWSPVDQKLAVISEDKVIEIWEARTQSPIMKVSGSGAHIHVSWSPDGKYLAVGNRYDVVVIIEVATGKILKKYKFPYGNMLLYFIVCILKTYIYATCRS